MSFARLLLSMAIVGGVPVAVIVCFLSFGSAAAYRLHIVDPSGDFLSGLLGAMALMGLIQVLPVPSAHRATLSLLWLARIGVTLGLMLFYESYYPSLDARGYYRDALLLSDPLALFEFGDGTANITVITGLMARVTHSYSLMKVAFSFIGLMSVYIAYRAATVHLRGERPALLLALGLFPSILFWTSILGKDPVTSLGVAIYAFGAVGFLTRRRVSDLAWIALGIAIAAAIRSWLSVIMIAPVLGTVFLTGRSAVHVKIAFSALAVPVFLLAAQGFAERFSIQSAQDIVAQTNEIARGWEIGGSRQKIEGGFDSLAGMIAFLPIGIFTALFRPLPGEVLNPFGLLAGLENALALGLLVKGALRRGVLAPLREPVVLWAVLFLLCWAAIYGFVSYNNLGTAFRYRQIVAPVLIGLALYLAYGPVPGARAARPAQGRIAPSPSTR